MAVPKKRISSSKKRIRKNLWKKKGYLTAIKAFSLGKSLLQGIQKVFFMQQINNKRLKKS